MKTLPALLVIAIVLTGCRSVSHLPRAVRFDDIPYPFITTSHAGDPDTGTIVLHFRPYDGAISVAVWAAHLDVFQPQYLAPGKTNLVEYTLTLLTNPRGDALAFECRAPFNGRGSCTIMPVSPEYTGETNLPRTPSIRVDGNPTDNFLRDWAEWMKVNPRLELEVLNLSEKILEETGTSQQSPRTYFSKAADGLTENAQE